MHLNLAKQTVVVFGAARGIGRAIAAEFANEGCRVHGFDRNPDPSPPPAGAGAGATSIQGDVTSYEQVRAFAAGLGEVDHVVYSVGIGSGKFGFPFWNLEPGDWARVLEINLIGAVNVAHAFAPKLIPRGKGSLLFLVSVAGQIGSQTDPPYSASKAANINFAQCLAKDLAPFGVRVNTVCPGMVRTSLNESVWRAWNEQQPAEQRKTYDDWATEKIQRVIPLGRWQHPEDIAAMIVFLCSPRAGEVTGQTINVDGGCVMHS